METSSICPCCNQELTLVLLDGKITVKSNNPPLLHEEREILEKLNIEFG